MPSPFYPRIKGTTGSAPLTGNYTPNGAVTKYRAWSNVPIGWMGAVEFDDGASKASLEYCVWDGTSLIRASNAYWSTEASDAKPSLSASATAALVVDPWEVQSHLGGIPWRGWFPVPGATVPTAIGLPAGTVVGTASLQNVAVTSYLTEQHRIQYASLTTANAQAGYHTVGVAPFVFGAASGRGGGELSVRFGASQLPTGPRLFVAMTSGNFSGNTGEPSAFVAHVAAFAKDSTDTNIQLLTNSNAGSGTKIDTGIAWAANGWYEGTLMVPPGGGEVRSIFARLDSPAIFYGRTTVDIPNASITAFPQVLGGLSSTTGTAINMQIGAIAMRSGS